MPRYSFRITVGCMFLLATLLTATIAVSMQYYFSSQFAQERAINQYSTIANDVSRQVNNLDTRATHITELLSSLVSKMDRDSTDWVSIFSKILQANNEIYSIYVGRQGDDFYQLINLKSSTHVQRRINATIDDRWVVITVLGQGNNRIKRTVFLNDQFKIRNIKTETSNYYPSHRPWFKGSSTTQVKKTEPYLFQNLKIPGQTFSMKVKTSAAVVGVDILLSTLSDKLRLTLDGYNTEAFLFRPNGEILASNVAVKKEAVIPTHSPLELSPQEQLLIENTRSLKVSNQNSWGPMDYAVLGEPKGYAIDVLNTISQLTGLKFEYINGFSWSELVEQFEDGSIDILHSLQNEPDNYTQGIFSDPIYSLPFGVLIPSSQKAINSLSELSNKRVAILTGNAIIPTLKINFAAIKIVEVDKLVNAIRMLESDEVDAVIDSAAVLRRTEKQYFINDVTILTNVLPFNQHFNTKFHIALQPKDSALMAIINRAINHITVEHKQALNQKWLEPLQQEKTVHDRLIPYAELYELIKDKTSYGKLVIRNIKGAEQFFYIQPVNYQGYKEYFAITIPKAFVLELVFDRIKKTIMITGGLLCFLLPIIWIMGSPIVNPINQLRAETLKINSRKYKDVKLVNTRIKEVWDLSESILRMSENLRKHEKQQEEFIESFIRLIAQAIDDKSHYTAGHCNRVPVLGMMLAEAAEQSELEAFKHFRFNNEDEKREFRIAAWLHDCGKITQPEHIVDKGTKLETNNNRIHEIRTRFEVLWRDAQIEYLNQQLNRDISEQQAKSDLEEQQKRLQDDFEFIAKVNIGSEYTSDEKIERVKRIANQTWLRHFDDCLGLSNAEETRMKAGKDSFPVVEHLLADKPEHIIPRRKKVEFDPQYKINMDVPEHLYNLGEIYNLSISRGTLTAEDRYKINEHMISGIKMLESLPFPEELKRVPRYATTHHETLKGTGYPRKLKAEDLSIPERILVIADIFEALTAADRPYKKAKPISVAIDIMYKMALDEHIDMQLFILFLESQTYMRYAAEFLNKEQIVPVDINYYIEAASKLKPELSYA
ncbi:MAG: transporter substrate-binding domain-containing protein [Aliivibrio sp.]|nr:transporter substrate-binding domain-containing protein [Aliivibrio sp.]